MNQEIQIQKQKNISLDKENSLEIEFISRKITDYSKLQYRRFVLSRTNGISLLDQQRIRRDVYSCNSMLQFELESIPKGNILPLMQVINKYEDEYRTYMDPDLLKIRGFKAKASIDEVMALVEFDRISKGIVKKPSEIKSMKEICEGRSKRLQDKLKENEKAIDNNFNSSYFDYFTISENQVLNEEIDTLKQKIKQVESALYTLKRVCSITNGLVSIEKTKDLSPSNKIKVKLDRTSK